MTNVSGIIRSTGLSFSDNNENEPAVNYLLILMLLQAKTSDLASNNQLEAAKKRRAAGFTQSLVDELKRMGGFSPETASSHLKFIEKLNKEYGSKDLSYNEKSVLNQMNTTLTRLDSMKSEMQKIQKEIEDLRSEVKDLEKDKKDYQKKVDEYVKKFKRGGFILPGYNAYLAAKIFEYREKRDSASDKISEKNGEINLKKIPELNVLKADVLRIQKGFEGTKETEAIKMQTTASDEIAQAQALLDAAMSASSLIRV